MIRIMESQRGLTDEEFTLFSDRVGRGLRERPLVVLPKEHREQVAELLRQLGEATYYHLLGIDPGSGAREVHEAYDREAGPARWTALRLAPTAQAPKEDEARRCLEQARHLAEGEDFHSAIELLRKAVFLAPTHESMSLLGLLLAKNPQWTDEAIETLERAEEMGSTDPAVPEALKELRETIKTRPVEGGKPGQTIPFRKPKRG